jgi:suppressor of ftsI/bilirubin oxidase
MSSATYSSVDPTDLSNFKNPLRLTGGKGLFALLDVSAGTSTRLTAREEAVEILPGKETGMLVYRAEQGGTTFLNPTFVVEKGNDFSAELANGLDEETTIHWHGLDLDWRMDGHPSRPVSAGATYRYEFPVRNRGGSYWYHPHPHGRTARQTYLGLAGMFLVRDDEERRLEEALGLNLGETDLPLILQDKSFGEDGALVYEPDEAAREMGVEGDVILVNLTPTPFLRVSARPYRFRVLNASNARTFRLAFAKSDGEEEPLTHHVLATDGSFLDRPRHAGEIFLAPGERVDLLLDLSGFGAGEEAVLKSLPFDPMHNEHKMDHGDASHMHMGPERLPDGHGFYLLKLLVGERVDHEWTVPAHLSELSSLDSSGATVRHVTLSMEEAPDGSTRWLIGGRSYEPDGYPIVVRKGTTEVWELRNEERSMPHPMHVHGVRFRVLERANSPEQVAELAVDEAGRTATDLGWKDTVLVWPGETVRVAMNFSHDFEDDQLYLLHCHILEHEDAGMMINYKVVP